MRRRRRGTARGGDRAGHGVGPLGIGWRTAWDNALAGTSTAGPITRFDASEHACRIACEVRGFEPGDHIDRRALRRMDRVSQFAVAASRLALDDAGLEIDGDGYGAGVVMSTGNGGSETFEEHHRTLLERGADRSSPLMVPVTIVNMSAGHVSIELGLRGPASCGRHRLRVGQPRHRRRRRRHPPRGGRRDAGRRDRGGRHPVLHGGPRRDPRPVAAQRRARARQPAVRRRPRRLRGGRGRRRPGAGEPRARPGPRSRDRVRGGRLRRAPPTRTTSPTRSRAGAGSSRPCARPWPRAGSRADEVDYVNAHGTSTATGDPVEVRPIRQLVGDERAARGEGVVHQVDARPRDGRRRRLRGRADRARDPRGAIPPTINLDELDEDCAGVDHVANEARRGPVRVALSNSFGFGGHNAVLALAAMEDG